MADRRRTILVRNEPVVVVRDGGWYGRGIRCSSRDSSGSCRIRRDVSTEDGFPGVCDCPMKAALVPVVVDAAAVIVAATSSSIE